MSERRWFGTPYSELTPVHRALAVEFISGSAAYDARLTAEERADRLVAVEELKASGPLASEEEVAVAAQFNFLRMLAEDKS